MFLTNKRNNAIKSRLNRNLKKTSIILIFTILTLIIFILNSKPFILSENNLIFNTIQPSFLILLLANYLLIFIVGEYNNNKFLLLSLVMLYNILFYSPNLFFYTPYRQTDIGSISKYLNIVKNTSTIGTPQIAIDNYFQWPIYFILSKILMIFFNTNINQTINLGFYIFVIIFPILITLTFMSFNINIKYILYIYPIFVVLSDTFINFQYVPQTLALIYTILLYSLYLKYKNNNSTPILLLSYITLIFCHPYFFIFFISAIILESIFSYKHNFIKSFKIPIFFSIIYLVCYQFIFTSLRGNISESLSTLGTLQTGAFSIFGKLFGLTTPSTSNSYQPHLLNNLWDSNLQSILSTSSRVILIGFMILFLINILSSYFKKQLQETLKPMDLGILISSFYFWLLGLISTFIANVYFELIFIPISKTYLENIRKFRTFKTICIILLVIAPVILDCTSLGNLALTGSIHIKDEEMENIGHIIDKYAVKNQKILAANNGNPTGYPNGFSIYSIEFVRTNNSTANINLIIYTPKMRMLLQYYGSNLIDDIYLNNNNIVLNNGLSYCLSPIRNSN
jgi:hypothetical protein